MYKFKKNIAHKSNFGATRKASSIRYIVVHFTANDGDHDESNANYFRTPNRAASAHYFVDDDSVTQSVYCTRIAWSVGGRKYTSCKTSGGGKLYGICTNANSISIELCDTVRDGKFKPTQATLDNAVILIKKLMKRYNVPTSRVIRHFDVTGKLCPVYFCNSKENDAAWEQFKKQLQ